MSSVPETNPYASPRYSGQPYSGTDEMGAAGVTPRTLEMLRQTQPWVRFISVLLSIGAGLMIVVGSLALIGIAIYAAAGRRGLFGLARFEMGIMVMYLVMGILYIMPAVYLSRYASNIGRLRSTLQVSQLESALEAQKSFWKFAGVMAVFMLILSLLGVVVSVLWFASESSAPPMMGR